MADEENNMEEEPKEEINEGEEEKKEDEPLLDSDGNPINPEDLKPKVPEAPLKLDMLRKSVKKLQRTYDGLSYAYTEIDLKEKEIDDLGTDIDNFTQIIDFNVSTNKITNINCVKNMPYIIRIDASVNEIRDMDAVVLAVAHKEFKEYSSANIEKMYGEGNRVLIDIKGILDRKEFSDRGISYWRL